MANGLRSIVFPFPLLDPPQDEPVEMRCHHVQDNIHHQAGSEGAVPGIRSFEAAGPWPQRYVVDAVTLHLFEFGWFFTLFCTSHEYERNQIGAGQA